MMTYEYADLDQTWHGERIDMRLLGACRTIHISAVSEKAVQVFADSSLRNAGLKDIDAPRATGGFVVGAASARPRTRFSTAARHAACETFSSDFSG